MARWPEGFDLADWISVGPVSDERKALYDAIVEAVTDVVWGDLDPAKMPDQTDQTAPEERCPSSVHLAVLILAARVDTRRQSTNGVIASGELFARVGADDPDYRRLIKRYAVSAEP